MPRRQFATPPSERPGEAMCTVTLLRLGSGFRIICNRDEARSRPSALEPSIVEAGTQRAVWPTDPSGGGTWVGVNGAGLVATLLNRNLSEPSSTPPNAPSRGTIAPKLLECGSLADAADQLYRLNARHFAPFQLLITDGDRVLRAESSATGLNPILEPLQFIPVMMTSSGLGDSLVAGPRSALLRSFFPDGVQQLDDALSRIR